SRCGNEFDFPFKDDRPVESFSFEVRLYFGTPKRLFARNHKPYECNIEEYSTPSKFSASTWIQAGTASVYIVETATGKDGRKVDGRRITKKLTELLDKEFAELSFDNFGKEGKDIQVQLSDSLQGGMYVLDIWSNQGQPGTFTVKATEITKGIPLSKHRLKEHDVKTYGDSSSRLYYSQLDFTIYEGNWEEYYGARIELWFTPDDGGPKRKVWEANCKIQGWQR
ncbi:MAG: hypothetical protein J5746_12880, partial [Victivallales bacterium]|nr:hypothetical protein [Victivallales bacterium]